MIATHEASSRGEALTWAHNLATERGIDPWLLYELADNKDGTLWSQAAPSLTAEAAEAARSRPDAAPGYWRAMTTAPIEPASDPALTPDADPAGSPTPGIDPQGPTPELPEPEPAEES